MRNETDLAAIPAPPAASGAPSPKVGRPRRWDTPQARQQAASKRRTERAQLLNTLFLAMLNAHWDEPQLQEVINHGTEPEILQALTQYYRRRHWGRRNATAPTTPRNGTSAETLP